MYSCLFPKKFNGVLFFIKETTHSTIFLDACLQGMGAIYKDCIYQVASPDILIGAPIAAYEMFNILVVIRIFRKCQHFL